MTDGLTTWHAWRVRDYGLAQESGEEALNLAQELDFVWPAKYVVFWPLIGVAIMQAATEKAVAYARDLLDPTQMRLRDAVTAVLQHAISAWENNQANSARTYLEQALKLAQTYHYL